MNSNLPSPPLPFSPSGCGSVPGSRTVPCKGKPRRHHRRWRSRAAITLQAHSGAPVKFYIGTSTPLVEIPNLLPGEYVLEIESYGYKSKTQAIAIGFGNTSLNLMIAPLLK